MPWYEKQMYIEGWMQERVIAGPEGQPQPQRAAVRRSPEQQAARNVDLSRMSRRTVTTAKVNWSELG